MLTKSYTDRPEVASAVGDTKTTTTTFRLAPRCKNAQYSARTTWVGRFDKRRPRRPDTRELERPARLHGDLYTIRRPPPRSPRLLAISCCTGRHPVSRSRGHVAFYNRRRRSGVRSALYTRARIHNTFILPLRRVIPSLPTCRSFFSATERKLLVKKKKRDP